MKRRTLALVIGLLVALLALFGSYLLSIAEPYEEEVKRGPSPEARANRFLAAERFLEGQQRTVSRASGLEVLDTLPSKGQTLLLLADRDRMTPRQAERVLAWAEQGGHLLFVAEAFWDEDDGKSGDLLLDLLDIRQYDANDLETLEEEQRSAPEDRTQRWRKPAPQGTTQGAPTVASGDRHPELTKLYLENEDEPAYFSFDTDYHLYDAQNRAHAWANSAQATHMLQLYHGKGVITVVTDHWLWQNRHIGKHDNAWLLWYLTQDSDVTLLHHAERDDLFSLLLKHFPQALIAALLLIALLLWRRGSRQGPLLLPARPARRQLEEHLRGSADFLLRRTSQQRLIQALQADIQRRARRRHPGFERLPVAEQWQILGRLSRQPPSNIGQAMRPAGKDRVSAAQFTRQVAYLQNLRNAL